MDDIGRVKCIQASEVNAFRSDLLACSCKHAYCMCRKTLVTLVLTVMPEVQEKLFQSRCFMLALADSSCMRSDQQKTWVFCPFLAEAARHRAASFSADSFNFIPRSYTEEAAQISRGQNQTSTETEMSCKD